MILFAKFPLGELYITSNANDVLAREDITHALRRHISGDWGDCCPEDKETNDRALIEGTRLFSVYQDSNQVKFWIITEHDRSVTTILLPEDY
jgi:hypothetical protein